MLPLHPFLSPSLPSDIANSLDSFHRKKIGNKGLLHDLTLLKIRSGRAHWETHSLFFFYDLKRMSSQPQRTNLKETGIKNINLRAAAGFKGRTYKELWEGS